jgi:uncharacterized membrane protein
MDNYRLVVWLHILSAIVLVGLALFWVIMRVALRQRFDAEATNQWLKVAKGARWPHVLLPHALRLPLPLVAWVMLLVAALSGVCIISLTRLSGGGYWSLKLWLLAGVVLMQAIMSWRPIVPAIVLNLLLLLATMVASGWLVRG